MSTIQISSYAKAKSSNYGMNAIQLVIGELTLWFSYQTVVAFHTPERGRVVRENEWGPTTNKHLNEIDGGDRASRYVGVQFEAMLDAELRKYNLVKPNVRV